MERAKLQEVILKGNVLSKGIGFGKPIFADSKIFFSSSQRTKDIDQQVNEFKKAIAKTKKQIIELKKSLAQDNLSITFDILNTHLEILNDPIIIDEVIQKIKQEKKSLQKIFQEIVEGYKKKIKDPFFKEKILDIAGVFKKILQNIKTSKIKTFQNIQAKAILFSDEIIPSDIFEIDESKIKAFISLSGCYESHAAIIARAKNIPFLSNIKMKDLKRKQIFEVIVDANKGFVILNPTKNTLQKYKNYDFKIDNIKKPTPLDKNINIFANLDNLQDLEFLLKKNINGIGLLRTEFLFAKKGEIPSAEEQFEVYKTILQKMSNKPCVFRLFDLGADKAFYGIKSSDNWGFKGIEVLLKIPKLLENQLKAIIKASAFGDLWLLIPFVKDIKQIYTLKQMIKKNCANTNIKIGSMIETPAAALMIDEIAKEVDFLSIGSNDLIKYTFIDQKCSHKILHPAFIKLVQMIIMAAKTYQRPLYFCGEISSEPEIFQKLVSLGIDNFSISKNNLERFY